MRMGIDPVAVRTTRQRSRWHINGRKLNPWCGWPMGTNIGEPADVIDNMKKTAL